MKCYIVYTTFYSTLFVFKSPALPFMKWWWHCLGNLTWQHYLCYPISFYFNNFLLHELWKSGNYSSKACQSIIFKKIKIMTQTYNVQMSKISWGNFERISQNERISRMVNLFQRRIWEIGRDLRKERKLKYDCYFIYRAIKL